MVGLSGVKGPPSGSGSPGSRQRIHLILSLATGAGHQRGDIRKSLQLKHHPNTANKFAKLWTALLPGSTQAWPIQKMVGQLQQHKMVTAAAAAMEHGLTTLRDRNKAPSKSRLARGSFPIVPPGKLRHQRIEPKLLKIR